MRVLITDSLSPVCVDMLIEAGLQPDVQLGKTPEELEKLVPGVTGWLIRSGTKVTAPLIAAATDLKVVGRAGVGVDNVDLEAATRRGVLVVNAPEGNTISTAEHTCAMILSLARRIPEAHISTSAGRWERSRLSGTELHGKTLGVIGVGKIGRTVAEQMQGFGMSVVGFDPVMSTEAAERLGIRLVDLDELYAVADIITCHAPLNDATRDLLNEETLACCKPGVRVVNCARGGIVNEVALLNALNSGHVAGAAFDVFTSEPPGPELAELMTHPRVVVTPHIAASTEEAQEKVAVQVAVAVIDALAGRPVTTAVNAGPLRAASQPEVIPFIELADRLGQTAAQLSEKGIERVIVRCSGDIVHRYNTVLTVAALKGLLTPWSDEPVNLINAPLLAREAGLSVEEHVVSEPGSFTNLVEVRIESGDQVLSVKGTVIGHSDVRLVELDGFRLEVRLGGHILFYRNVDRPGMVAAVGGLLAKHGINIASLALGRMDRGGMALSAFAIDEMIPREVLSEIAAIDGVRDVKLVYLPN